MLVVLGVLAAIVFQAWDEDIISPGLALILLFLLASLCVAQAHYIG